MFLSVLEEGFLKFLRSARKGKRISLAFSAVAEVGQNCEFPVRRVGKESDELSPYHGQHAITDEYAK